MKTCKKSVCFLSPYIIPVLCRTTKNTGGAERQFALFGRYLHERGWNVSYVVDKNYMHMIENEPSWCELYPINISYLGGSSWNIFPGVISLISAMIRSDTKVFVVKTQAFLLLPISFFCRLFGKKLVFWMQNDRDCRVVRKEIPLVLSWSQNMGMKLVNLFVAQSKYQKSELHNNFGYQATVVPSIALSVSDKSDFGYCDKFKSDGPVVLWCGNSSRNKRQEVFFELVKMMPDVEFVMAVGKADTLRYNQAQIEAEKKSNLRFLGSVPPQEMEAWFSKVDLYVNTSLLEGFPNTFLQAWQAGIPVVSLNVDPDGVLSDKQLGIVVKNKICEVDAFDFKALASAIVPEVKSLIADSNLRCQIGKRAQEYVLRNHSGPVVGSKLDSALLELI